MINDSHTKPGRNCPETSVSRRRFFYQSGAALLTTSLLTSCSELLQDIIPSKNRPGSESQVDVPKGDQTLAFFGDSLTIGAGASTPYGNLVSSALAGRAVVSDGIVGQIAMSIAIRQGGTPLKISVEGGKLDGTKAVKVTRLNNEFLSTPINHTTYSRTGTIADVKCTITRKAGADGVEQYTIEPASESTADIPEDSVFVLDGAVQRKTATQILWYGRNNIGRVTAEEEIVSAVESSIAYISEPKRYLVLGVLLAASDVKGTGNYKQVTAINDTLSARYGKNYVAMTPPTDEEMEAVGYTPNSKDRSDLAKLNFPRGLRENESTDEIHLNDKGYQIVANRVVQKLKELRY
jgi:lysophospholipase L1-like esterase